jgi:UDP-glucose 4-epimerase
LNFIKDLPKLPIILFSSSAAVYGNPDTIPIPENHKLNPISPYGNTKLIIELLLKDYQTAYGINSACFRYFNAAGAWINEFDLGQEPGATHIIAKALEASIAGTEFTINGNDFLTSDRTAIRDYVHVNDIADAHINAVEYLKNNSGFHVFNLGTNSGISNKEIANYINTNYGLKNIIFGEHRKGDPAELIADSTKAKTALNWVPQFSDIDIIIDSAYRWYKTIHQI